MNTNYKENWLMTEVMRPYFGPKLGSKLVGHRLIFWVIVPTVLNGLFLV